MTALLGRREALTVLDAFLQPRALDGGALLLVGEPGVGKTALLDAVADTAKETFQVVRASGVEFESDVSFAGLHQVLLPLVEGIPQLAPRHAAALSVALGLADGAPDGRLVVAAAALTLLRRAAGDRPLMVVVDDLHWLDRASAQVLGSVARRLASTQVRLLAAQRTAEPSFFEQAGIPWLAVPPLDDHAAADLLRSRFPDVAASVRARLVTESQGIPLALLELPHELSRAQQRADEALPATLVLGRTLQTVFASRVTSLGTPTRRLLLLAALDTGGDQRITHQTLDGGHRDDLGPAERARLISVDASSHRLVFAHPLIRSAVVALATAAERRSAHTALAELFDDDPDIRAHHLAEATTAPDEAVAVLLEQAAYRVLRRGDPVAAVTTLLRSAELSSRGSERARRLTEAAWVGADVTGALRDVTRLLAEARRADPQPDSSLSTAVLAAFVLLNSDGDVDTAHRLLVGALASTGPRSVPGHVLDEAMQTLMLVCFFGDRPRLWLAFDDALRRFGPELSPIQVVAATTFADPLRSDPDTLTGLDEIIAGLPQETDPTRVVRVAIAANFVGRLDGCRGSLLRVVGDGRGGGAVASAVSALLLLAVDEFLAGRWEEARALAEEGIALCVRHGYPMLAWPGRYALALVAAAVGDGDLCRQLTSEMLQWAVPRGALIVSTYSRHAAGIAALSRGDHEDAFELLASVNPPGLLGPREAYALWTVLDLVEAAVRSGHRDTAAVHLASMVAAGLASISPRQAYLCAGAAAMAADDDHHAVELFDAASAMPGPDRWPFDRARLELAHGERLRRLHALTAARVHLSIAVEIFDRLGARPWAERARAELRATGLTRRSVVSDPRRAGLTPQERAIALLAATGMTNKQIGERLALSPRTVSAHLYRIFPKLAVTARAGLRDALDALGDGDGDGGGPPTVI